QGDARAFGGPIFYGHSASIRRGDNAGRSQNVWAFQGEQARAILATLEPAQRMQAVVTARQRAASKCTRGDTGEPGVRVSALDGAQRQMVRWLLAGVVRPFRALGAGPIESCLYDDDQIGKLRLTFFDDGDLGEIWKIEGPAFTWYY